MFKAVIFASLVLGSSVASASSLEDSVNDVNKFFNGGRIERNLELKSEKDPACALSIFNPSADPQPAAKGAILTLKNGADSVAFRISEGGSSTNLKSSLDDRKGTLALSQGGKLGLVDCATDKLFGGNCLRDSVELQAVRKDVRGSELFSVTMTFTPVGGNKKVVSCQNLKR